MKRLHSKKREHRRRNHRRRDPHRLTSSAHCRRVTGRERREGFQRVRPGGLIAKVEKIRRGHSIARDATRVCRPHTNQPIRLVEGKRPKHDSVDDAEDRRVGTDAEGERGDRRGCEPRAPCRAIGGRIARPARTDRATGAGLLDVAMRCAQSAFCGAAGASQWLMEWRPAPGASTTGAPEGGPPPDGRASDTRDRAPRAERAVRQQEGVPTDRRARAGGRAGVASQERPARRNRRPDHMRDCSSLAACNASTPDAVSSKNRRARPSVDVPPSRSTLWM